MTDGRLVLIAGKDPEQELGGGHASYVRAHARVACAIGFRPDIVCMAPVAGVVEAEYGRVHRLPLSRGPLRSRAYTPVVSRHSVWHVRPLARALIDLLEGETRPILLHGFSLWGLAAIRAARVLRARGQRCTTLVSTYTAYAQEYRSKLEGAVQARGHWHSAADYGWWLFARAVLVPMERRICRGSDMLLGNYRSVQGLLEHWHGPLPHFRCVPYAAETAFMPAAPSVVDGVPPGLADLRPAEAPCIVSVSRHDPRKGVDVLIQALALLRNRGVPFRAAITSGGERLTYHRALAARLGLPSTQVVLTGYVDDVRPWLHAADVFCLPSIEEQSGSVSLLEALQAAKACVATAIDGIPEDVDHGVHAWLVPARDPVALADGLARLLGDPALRTRLAAAARARFEERFTASAMSRAFHQIYTDCLTGLTGTEKINSDLVDLPDGAI